MFNSRMAGFEDEDRDIFQSLLSLQIGAKLSSARRGKILLKKKTVGFEGLDDLKCLQTISNEYKHIELLMKDYFDKGEFLGHCFLDNEDIITHTSITFHT